MRAVDAAASTTAEGMRFRPASSPRRRAARDAAPSPARCRPRPSIGIARCRLPARGPACRGSARRDRQARCRKASAITCGEIITDRTKRNETRRRPRTSVTPSAKAMATPRGSARRLDGKRFPASHALHSAPSGSTMQRAPRRDRRRHLEQAPSAAGVPLAGHRRRETIRTTRARRPNPPAPGRSARCGCLTVRRCRRRPPCSWSRPTALSPRRSPSA